MSEQEPALIKRMKATEPTPSTVRFWQGEDTYKDVPVPKVRKRWAQILEVADRIVWTHCELLDARNRTLAMLQNDEPASELEDLNEGGMGVSRIGELKQLMEVMGKGQDRVLAHQREEIKAILSATANVVNNLGNAVAVLSKTYERAISVATEGTKMLPAADERTESQKMLEQMAPMIIAALMKGESPEAAARAGAQAAARSAAAEAASKAASGANGAAKAGKA